jgi:hypothetical protein
MRGKWIGKYWCSEDVSGALKDKEVEFELTIDDHSNSKISGNVFDNVDMGGTEGIGTFFGTIKGDKIKFVKRMPIKTLILEDGTTFKEEKPHRPIYYRGSIDPETGLIQGIWKFKIGVGFVKGQIVLYAGTSGKWQMKRA